MNILIASDNVTLRQAVASYLKSKSLAVIESPSNAVDNYDVDVAIVDEFCPCDVPCLFLPKAVTKESLKKLYDDIVTCLCVREIKANYEMIERRLTAFNFS